MFDLKGRKALVTGASGGIGGAIAEALSTKGAEVGLSGTRIDALEALAGEIGGGTHILPADLLSAEGAEKLVKEAMDALGGIDILINNAGLTRDLLSMRLSNADWQSVIDINLTAAFRLSRNVFRGMMKRRWGRMTRATTFLRRQLRFQCCRGR